MDIELTPDGLNEAVKIDKKEDVVSPSERPDLFPGRDEKAQIQDAYVPKTPAPKRRS